MTFHTQPPAGDDLVARLRGKGRTFGRPTELELEAADRLEALTSQPMNRDERQAAWAALRMVRDAIGELFGPAASIDSEEGVLHRGPEYHHEAEAIVAALQRLALSKHTEPVAGEVEVVAWLVRGDPELGDYLTKSREAAERSNLGYEPLVTKSSYDALAAAKDAETAKRKELLDRCVRLNNRAEAAEASLEAIERQRDALREALTPSADTKAAYAGEFYMGLTLSANGEEDYRQVQIPWTTIKEIVAAIRERAALKDEGSAR